MGAKQRKRVYLCTQCRRLITAMDQVLLVEEGQLKGFCSETCILNFYTPLMDFYRAEEAQLRKHYLLPKSEFPPEPKAEALVAHAIEHPQEVWFDSNELGEETYVFLGPAKDISGPKLWTIVIAMIFNRTPSLVLFHTVTTSEDFVQEYRQGQKIEDLEKFLEEKLAELPAQEMSVPDEVVESMEQKKSALLADLLKRRISSDIPLEDFMLYENYIAETLEKPDEIYQYEEDDGTKVYTYIKFCEKNKISFYSFVICLKISDDQENEEDVLVPILSFPSLDTELYKHYQKGEQMVGGLKN